MIRLVSALVLLAIAVVPTRAHADARSEARTRMERATALHGQGKFAEALIELTTAYSLDPQPEVLYAIAQTHVQLGDCPLAIVFYERFLSTHPEAVPEAAAQEAIDACRTGTIGHAAPVKPVGSTASRAPRPPPPERSRPAPWYSDKVGDALVGGGLVLGVVALVGYRAAVGELDDADAAADYQQHADQVDGARSKRAFAAVCAVGGAGLVGAGIARFVLHRRSREARGLAIVPAPGGGLVGWSGRF